MSNSLKNTNLLQFGSMAIFLVFWVNFTYNNFYNLEAVTEVTLLYPVWCGNLITILSILVILFSEKAHSLCFGTTSKLQLLYVSSAKCNMLLLFKNSSKLMLHIGLSFTQYWKVTNVFLYLPLITLMDVPVVLCTGGHHSLEVTILVDLVGIGALPRAMGSLQLTKAIGTLVSVPAGGKPATSESPM